MSVPDILQVMIIREAIIREADDCPKERTTITPANIFHILAWRGNLLK